MTMQPLDLPEVELRSGWDPLDSDVERACRIGLAALILIHQTLRQLIEPQELGPALCRLDAGEALGESWDRLGELPDGMATISLLQLVDSLAFDADYQLARYGLTSLSEDHKELLQTLRHIGVRV
jgi:hypothetical protein